MCRFENCSPTENENSSSNLQINQFSNRFAPGCSGKLRAPAPVVFPWRRSDLGSSRGRVENRLREAHLSGRPEKGPPNKNIGHKEILLNLSDTRRFRRAIPFE